MALQPVLSGRLFRRLLFGVSVIACVVQLGLQSLAIFAFSALTIGVARLKFPVFPRAAFLVAIWLALLVPKFWMTKDELIETVFLYVCWAGFPFAAVYLVVERARGALDKLSWFDEALYLLVLPRFITPFYQPISVAKFFASERPGPNIRLALRALALGVYGAALQIVLVKVAFAPLRPGIPDPQPSAVLLNFVLVYAHNAGGIFCGVALLRLFGFDLGSGFRLPLISRSFGEFFRRWNYYIYEEVFSLFLLPLAARLRRWLPDTAATIVAAYCAIIIGAFCFTVLMVPSSQLPYPKAVFEQLSRPKTFVMYGLYYSAIILPQFIAPKSLLAGAPGVVRRVLEHALFIVLFVLFQVAATRAGVGF
jgi:hypothetical protein